MLYDVGVACVRHAGGSIVVVGFCGCVVGVGLRFGWGSCKLFILLPVGERLGLAPGVFAGCVWWFENSIVCTVLLAMGRIRVGVACGS